MFKVFFLQMFWLHFSWFIFSLFSASLSILYFAFFPCFLFFLPFLHTFPLSPVSARAFCLSRRVAPGTCSRDVRRSFVRSPLPLLCLLSFSGLSGSFLFCLSILIQLFILFSFPYCGALFSLSLP